MRKHNIIRYAGLGIVLLMLTIILGLFIWSATGTYPAGASALRALESTDDVTIRQDQYITFEPDEETDTGLIFYPGGLVEPAAYAPVLHLIAEEGVLVVIATMPFNLAIFNSGVAGGIMDAFPEISKWTLAGHSLGGAAAGIFAENHSDELDAIVFWDSYPPDSADLSDNDLRALSVYGTMDGFPNTDNFDEKRPLLPADAIFTSIEGANHAQFGDYGPQKGDVAAVISMERQHEIVRDIMLEFIFQGK